MKTKIDKLHVGSFSSSGQLIEIYSVSCTKICFIACIDIIFVISLTAYTTKVADGLLRVPCSRVILRSHMRSLV